MKYFSYEEIKGYGLTDEYSFYNIDTYPLEIINKWFSGKKESSKQYERQEMYCLKMVSEKTFYNLYRRLFNPVNIGYYNNKVTGEFKFYAFINSIDDACIRIFFDISDNIEKKHMLTNKLIEYVDSKDILDGDDFIKFGESLGGKNESY